jgi:MoaE-MoaD fusion protein
MRVRVRLFAQLHEVVGEREVTLDLADGATVAELRTQLASRYPALGPHLANAVCAVDEEYVAPDRPLREGDDVALIPPVSGGEDLFEVTREPLDPARLTAAVRRDESGAVVLFHGVARNNSGGRRVVALEYDAYPEMAARKLREVAEEVRAQFEITGIAVQHRIGRLAIGDVSLLVAVSSAHRREAFEACQHAVDRIKQTVPVWKKEIWEDGDGAWVTGHAVDLPEHAEA